MNRKLAVADLHGMYDLWRRIIDSLDKTDILYMLGDAADRGLDGWKIIKEALTDPRVIYIRGNHDQMLLDAWKSDWCDTDLWMYNGGYKTFQDVLSDHNSEIYLSQLNRTPYYYEYFNKNNQKVLLSHAGWTLLADDEFPERHDLLWGRAHIEDQCRWWKEAEPNVYMVHGHTPIPSSRFLKRQEMLPEDTVINETKTVCRYAQGHKICIDARCFATNKIAMLDLDTFEEIVFEPEVSVYE